jgi:hypothetical protein
MRTNKDKVHTPKPVSENDHIPSLLLSIEQSDRLRVCEAVIEKGLQTFVDVGNAFLEIRETGLYRQEFDTFEDYCRKRWHMTYRRAAQLMAAAETVQNLNHGSEIRPISFRVRAPEYPR